MREYFFPFCLLFGDGKFKGQTRAKVGGPKKGVAEAFLLGGGEACNGAFGRRNIVKIFAEHHDKGSAAIY